MLCEPEAAPEKLLDKFPGKPSIEFDPRIRIPRVSTKYLNLTFCYEDNSDSLEPLRMQMKISTAIHPLRRFAAFALSSLSLLAAGCASITDGTSQTLIFKVTPIETRCAVSRDGQQLGSFTGKNSSLTVSKGAKDIIIACESPGYEGSSQRISSSTQTAGVVGGLIDLGITDMLTGAMWKYPNEITIALEKTPEKAK